MAQSFASRRALIVDDEFLIAFDLEASMRELGFDVCAVASNERDATCTPVEPTRRHTAPASHSNWRPLTGQPLLEGGSIDLHRQ